MPPSKKKEGFSHSITRLGPANTYFLVKMTSKISKVLETHPSRCPMYDRPCPVSPRPNCVPNRCRPDVLASPHYSSRIRPLRTYSLRLLEQLFEARLHIKYIVKNLKSHRTPHTRYSLGQLPSVSEISSTAMSPRLFFPTLPLMIICSEFQRMSTRLLVFSVPA